MIQKCSVKIIGNKVVCDNITTEKEQPNVEVKNFKNKDKLKHLIDIGMDIKKYHPTILRTMIEGGRNFKIPETLRNQLILFATEAHEKGFNPSLFGYNTTLHKFIKSVHKIPKRKYIMKKKQGGMMTPIKKEQIQSSSSSSSSESDTDIEDVLEGIEDNLQGGRITEVKQALKKYKNKIPDVYYKTVLKSIK
jgi:hypothetical protein